MPSHFVRVPPDSSGKRLTQLAFMEVSYTSLVGGSLRTGDVLTTAGGFIGVVTHVDETDATNGVVRLVLNSASTESLTASTLLLLNNATKATVVSDAVPYYVTHNILVGGNDPKNHQHIDNRGAANMRFAEGAPVFDAFGNIKISDSSMIGVYEFANDPMTDLHTEETANGGDIQHDTAKSLIELSVTTASGSSATRTTNKYHFYWPGTGNEAVATVGLGNTGVVGNTRQWGYFDENNGVFFELAGTTLNVVMRSKVSGSVVETRVPQTEWNVDKLDGSGLSGITMDVSKINIYWIDLQWLGGGRVRMGTYRSDGVRTTCHEFRNAGENDYPYMQNGSLPWRVANFNTALTAQPCVLRHVCTAVRTSGKVDYTYWRYSHVHPQKAIGGSNVPILSMRSKNTYNSVRNVVNVYPEKYTCYVSGTGAMRLDFTWPITLTGENYNVDDGTTLEFDHSASSATVDAEYWLVHSVYLTPGAYTIDLSQFFDDNDEGIIRGSTATPPQVPFTLVGSVISGAPVIDGTFTYKELR